MSAFPLVSRAETVHATFRGATEFVKLLRIIALGMDFVAAALAGIAIFSDPQRKSGWYSLWILILAVVSVVLRAYSGQSDSFAQRCRKTALRAFALGKDVDAITEALLDDETPPLIGLLAKWLPAKSLDDYYEPVSPPGIARLRELYAHSAFYTWRLLRIFAVLTGLVGVAVFVGSGIFIYALAMNTTIAATSRQAVLETISTVVLLVFSIRALETAWKAVVSYRSVHQIENELLKKPEGQSLLDLVDSYDMERAAGPNPPTTLYVLRRGTLQQKWHRRREALLEPTAKTP